MLQAPREEKERAIDCLDCLLQFYAAASTTTCSSWLCVNPPHGAYAYFCSANVLAVHFLLPLPNYCFQNSFPHTYSS